MQVYSSIHGDTQVYTGIHRYAQAHTSIHWYTCDTVQFKELPSGLVSYSHCDNQQCGKKLSTLPKNSAVMICCVEHKWSPCKEWGFKGQYCTLRCLLIVSTKFSVGGGLAIGDF